MNRPFSQTMQAQQVDQHRMWMLIVAGSILMLLAWATWGGSPDVVAPENQPKPHAQPAIRK